jgi:hypothetical protein
LGLNILASWIYDRWVKSGTPTQSLKVEYAEVTSGGMVARWRRVEGPAEQVCKLLQQESQALTTSSPRVSSSPEDDDNWWKEHSHNEAIAALAVANELVREADQQLSQVNNQAAESLLRRALAKLREAVLWEPTQESHRKRLNELGERIHDQFGCVLGYHDGSYWVNCPVSLSHSRLGFSVAGTARTICSICGENMLTCPHVKGRTYDQITARKIQDKRCNICGESECEHIVGTTHDKVRAFGILVDLAIDHISFVENPANPLAVIYQYSLTKSDLMEMLPKEQRDSFEYGTCAIRCDHCKICKGS